MRIAPLGICVVIFCLLGDISQAQASGHCEQRYEPQTCDPAECCCFCWRTPYWKSGYRPSYGWGGCSNDYPLQHQYYRSREYPKQAYHGGGSYPGQAYDPPQQNYGTYSYYPTPGYGSYGGGSYGSKYGSGYGDSYGGRRYPPRPRYGADSYYPKQDYYGGGMDYPEDDDGYR